MLKRGSVFLFGIIMLTSCSPFTSSYNRLEVDLQSEKQVYTTDEEIKLKLENTTDKVLYLNYCGPTLIYQLELKAKEVWINAGGGICLGIYASEFVPTVDPGESKVIELYRQQTGQYRYNLSYRLSSASSKEHQINTDFAVEKSLE